MSKYQLLPPLTCEEYEALKNSIREHGVLVPVEYDEDGNILDGHHRVKICQELGITEWPSFVRVGLSEDEKIERIMMLNIARRHLPKEWKQQKAKKLREQGWIYQRIARVLGVSAPTILNWLENSDINDLSSDNSDNFPTSIIGKDGKHYPATKPQRRPTVLVDKPKDIERVAKAVETAKDIIPNKRVELKRLERIAREAHVETHKDYVLDETIIEDVQMYHCDFRELPIDAGTVDLIFTDPPYPKEYLPLWSDLAQFAARVLKDGAPLITYIPQFWFPEIIWRLMQHLEYFWLGSLYQPGAHNIIHPYQIRTLSKPLLFLSKGNYVPRGWLEDTVVSEGRQKDCHEWQQSLGPALHFVEKLTLPGELIVDPFLGAGTTALAAKQLGRRFIGCDIDANAIAAAKQRLAGGDTDD